MSIMNGKEMMAVCEEKGLLVPHDDIPIIGLDGTVVKNTTVTYPTLCRYRWSPRVLSHKALELADWNNVGMRMKGYAPIWPYNRL